jgi:hypothetical protein
MATSTFYGKMPLRTYRHMIHPPSKLLLGNDKEMITSKF